MTNPFNDRLDWTLQGKHARVYSETGTYEGWIERVHHQRGSVIMHSSTNVDTGEQVGSVFIRTPTTVMALKPKRRIEYREVDELEPYVEHLMDFEPRDSIMRRVSRNGYAGGFPVIREDGTILNGHKRIEACRRVGADKHPVEVVDVTDDQAGELFRLAHRNQEDNE